MVHSYLANKKPLLEHKMLSKDQFAANQKQKLTVLFNFVFAIAYFFYKTDGSKQAI